MNEWMIVFFAKILETYKAKAEIALGPPALVLPAAVVVRIKWDFAKCLTRYRHTVTEAWGSRKGS